MHLALDNHRVDQHAEIIDRRPLFNSGDASLGINLQLADMHARRESEVGRVIEGTFLQARLQLLPVELVRDVSLQGDRAEIDGFVGALDGELAVLELDVFFRGLQHVAGDLLGLGLDLVERLRDRRHANRAGARAIGAHAHLHLVGVAMDDRHIFDRYAEPARDQLGEGRFMPLPVRMRAGENLHRANRIDPHFRRFPQADAGAERADRRRGRDAAGFNVRRETDAAQFAVFGALALALADVFVIRHLQRLVERGGVIAAIIAEDHRRLVREGFDVVFAAEGGGIRVGLARRYFNEALDNESSLRATRAAVGVHRRGVGVDRVNFRINVGDIILARQQRRVEIGRHGGREGRQIGAEIGGGVDTQRSDAALVVQRQRGFGDMVAAMRVGEERLGTIRRPLDRTPDFLRRPDADCLFGVDENLRAETAADIRRDDAQLVLGRDADEGGEHEARHMRVLAGGVEGEAVSA